MTPSTSRRPRPRVLIAGGGVGAVEAALALRELLGPVVTIELVAPEASLVYRPLAVAEPFGYAAARELPLARLKETHEVGHLRGVVEQVDPRRGRARLGEGEWRGFDALIVATGARMRRWLPGALTFGGHEDVNAVTSLLDRIRRGAVQRVLFVTPPEPAWPLPIYELVLLTAAWAADERVDGLELHLVTPDVEPLPTFGPAAGRAVRDLLSDRGVRLHAGRTVTGIDGDHVRLDQGPALVADEVVTLPELAGGAIAGLPSDRDGFIPVGADGAVENSRGVWAVGDVIAGAVKMGGLATQQADAAASAIARFLGASVRAQPAVSELRGILLTGVASAFLRARLDDHEGEGTVAFNPLWMPPAKIAGRLLAPYLAAEAGVVATPVLVDRAPVPTDRALADRDEIRALALTLAYDDAAHGEYRSALRWLQTVEWLDGALTRELAELRDRWGRAARPDLLSGPRAR